MHSTVLLSNNYALPVCGLNILALKKCSSLSDLYLHVRKHLCATVQLGNTREQI